MPNIELGGRGREQLHKTLYAWVVVFFEEPGIVFSARDFFKLTFLQADEIVASPLAGFVKPKAMLD